MKSNNFVLLLQRMIFSVILTSIILFLIMFTFNRSSNTINYNANANSEYGNIVKKSTFDNIRPVKEVVNATINSGQTYFYANTRYKNMSFKQMVRSNDYISSVIVSDGVWGECQDLFNVYLLSKKDGVFVDVGANIGSCSFVFAQAGVKVYAFEPIPNNLYPFSSTTLANPLFSKLITIYPYGLGKEEGKKVIQIYKSNWGGSSMYNEMKGDYTEVINVKRLDDFDRIIPRKISVLKIDVEAGEYDVVEGAKEFFKNHYIEYIHIEAKCGKKDKNGRFGIERMIKILNDLGFDLVKPYSCRVWPLENLVVKRKVSLN